MYQISVALVDQNQIIRVGLADFLLKGKNFKTLYQAENIEKLLEQIQPSGKKPDIVIVDLKAVKKNNYAECRLIKDYLPDCQIILLADHEKEFETEDATKIFANGFLSKEYGPEQVRQALEKVYQLKTKAIH